MMRGGMPGAEHLRDSHELERLLRGQVKDGRLYGAICASPAVVLAHHGMLEGKQATVYPSLSNMLPEEYVDQPVVVDGNCVTSAGPGTAMAFALKLVEFLCGPAKAKEVADGMLFG